MLVWREARRADKRLQDLDVGTLYDEEDFSGDSRADALVGFDLGAIFESDGGALHELRSLFDWDAESIGLSDVKFARSIGCMNGIANDGVERDGVMRELAKRGNDGRLGRCQVPAVGTGRSIASGEDFEDLFHSYTTVGGCLYVGSCLGMESSVLNGQIVLLTQLYRALQRVGRIFARKRFALLLVDQWDRVDGHIFVFKHFFTLGARISKVFRRHDEFSARQEVSHRFDQVHRSRRSVQMYRLRTEIGNGKEDAYVGLEIHKVYNSEVEMPKNVRVPARPPMFSQATLVKNMVSNLAGLI